MEEIVKMSYICPVCNGLEALEANCSNCFHHLDDFGRVDQIWEPYAPYREIDDMKFTNGYDDFEKHNCIHITSCPSCGKDQLITIEEIYQT